MKLEQYCSGLQHVGLPTADIGKTLAFYQRLGFHIACDTQNGTKRVAFLRLKDLTLEVYESDQAAGKEGAIDHLALNVSDVDAVHAWAVEQGLAALEPEVRFLPFWDRGVRFFTVPGPNGEKIEFNQML